MRSVTSGTKRHILEAAYKLFYKAGFARASVDAIADAAGVTKRTLYYHFSSKDELLGAVLDLQHELVMATIQRWAKPVSAEPSAIVEVLFREFAQWAKQRGWQGSGFTRAAMELADSPGHPARAAARRHKATVENWLAAQFSRNDVKNPQQLARQVMLLVEGCHSLILIHGDKGYTETASRTARLLIDLSSQRSAETVTRRNSPIRS